jgi:hypothetical protein
MTTLTLRERRLIALALLLFVIAVFLLGILMPILDGFKSRRDLRGQYYSQMERNDRSINNLSTWRRQANVQKQEAARFALIAPSRSNALEKFREEMLQFFVKNGATVRSAQDVPSGDGWLKLRIDSQMSLTQLVDCLKRLQQSERASVVDAITISADRAFTNGRLSPMDIRLEISIPYSTPTPR